MLEQSSASGGLVTMTFRCNEKVSYLNEENFGELVSFVFFLLLIGRDYEAEIDARLLF